MITEFLTNSHWLNPQIDFLIYLQNIRMQTGGIFDGFFVALTKLGELFWPTVFICILYWCVDAKAGLYLCLVNGTTLIFSQLLKMVACIYRPWVFNDAVKPSDYVLKTAKGYSFPSGHAMMAVSSWGGIAYLARKKPIICIFFVLLTLLIGFSRLYLGVHTLQDVIVGLLTGAFFIFTLNRLVNWCEKDLNRYLYVLGIINIVVVVVLCYILFKDYPLDYVNGELLVDPRRGIDIAVIYMGWIMGLVNGVILCRRFFPFDANNGSKKSKIIRALVGIATSTLLFYVIQENIFYNRVITDYKAVMSISFFVAFYMTAIYPLIFSRVFKI